MFKPILTMVSRNVQRCRPGCTPWPWRGVPPECEMAWPSQSLIIPSYESYSSDLVESTSLKKKNLQHRIYSRVSYRIVSQYMVVHACSCYLWYLKALELFLASCHRGALTSGDAGILTAWQNITIPELVPWISSKHSGKPRKTMENQWKPPFQCWKTMVFHGFSCRCSLKTTGRIQNHGSSPHLRTQCAASDRRPARPACPARRPRSTSSTPHQGIPAGWFISWKILFKWMKWGTVPPFFCVKKWPFFRDPPKIPPENPPILESRLHCRSRPVAAIVAGPPGAELVAGPVVRKEFVTGSPPMDI